MLSMDGPTEKEPESSSNDDNAWDGFQCKFLLVIIRMRNYSLIMSNFLSLFLASGGDAVIFGLPCQIVLHFLMDIKIIQLQKQHLAL
jgi:hypothetical protein